ncbi:MAG: hypothetical protein LBB47_02710 [Spirochaetaceae bacterium]|nr:hypothetical protein [Spirochaetaceae bacterium]
MIIKKKRIVNLKGLTFKKFIRSRGKMKSKILIVLIASIGSILIGCATFPVEPLPPGGSESQIVGVWELKPSGNQYPQVFSFEEDGRWSRQNIGDVPQTGYYSFDGANLKLVNKHFSVTTSAGISGDTLTIIYSNNSYWVYNKKTNSN